MDVMPVVGTLIWVDKKSRYGVIYDKSGYKC